MISGVRSQEMGPFPGTATITSSPATMQPNACQTVCGHPVALRPHANDPRNGLVLHAEDVQAALRVGQLAGLRRMDGHPVANIIDQQTGLVFRDEYEVDLNQDYGMLFSQSPQASPMSSPHSSPRAVRKAPSRAAPQSADQDQKECDVCFQDLGHKAGRYSMNCRCAVKPCYHRLVCNACGVFFADETVKRREQPARKHPGKHMHTEKFKVHCQACSYERYERCLAAHMKPSRVGNRKKRSPKVKRAGRKATALVKETHNEDMMALADAAQVSAKILADSEAESAAESNPGSPSESDLERSHDSMSAQSMCSGLTLLSLAAAELERCPIASG